MHHSILIQIHHIFMKIATSINSGGDLHVHRQVYHGYFACLCTFFGQTEGILEKYCILAQSEVHYWLAL